MYDSAIYFSAARDLEQTQKKRLICGSVYFIKAIFMKYLFTPLGGVLH